MAYDFIRVTTAHNNKQAVIRIRKIDNLMEDDWEFRGKVLGVTVIWLGGSIQRVTESVQEVERRITEALGRPIAPPSTATADFLTAANTKRLR